MNAPLISSLIIIFLSISIINLILIICGLLIKFSKLGEINFSGSARNVAAFTLIILGILNTVIFCFILFWPSDDRFNVQPDKNQIEEEIRAIERGDLELNE